MFKPIFTQLNKPPVCPYCQANNNALSGHGMARKGDIAICWTCCKPAIIEVKPLRLRKPKSRKEAKACDGAIEVIKSEI